jgi:hypothetical protein
MNIPVGEVFFDFSTRTPSPELNPDAMLKQAVKIIAVGQQRAYTQHKLLSNV